MEITTLIEQLPHLKDPLLLYQRELRFCTDALALLPGNGALMVTLDSKAFPRDVAGAVLDRFAGVFDLPADSLKPLQLALEVGDIDFTRLPLNEVPAFSLPYPEEELASMLFLLSRPYFLRLRESCLLDGRMWDEGRCPVCSAEASLSSVTEGPSRRLHCSFCGTVGPYRYIGCPSCGTEDVSQLGTLVAETEKGFRVSTCDSCRSYVKVAEGRVLHRMSADLADLASIPLDIVAQGKGYVRQAPNPIGMRRMI